MSRSADDWEYLHIYCEKTYKIHISEYPRTSYGPFPYIGRTSVQPYLEALDVFAGDRKEATLYAQDAQAQGHPLYFNRFMDLAELVHEAGNEQGLRLGATELLIWEDRWGHPLDWKTLCMKVRDFGIPLFDKAKKLGFDKEIVCERVQILLHRSLVELDKGTEYIPSVLFHSPPDGSVKPEADEGLGWVEEVRELTRYFELDGERDYATDIMNRYLKKALCLLQRGHQWYLDLSNKYKLDEAKEYIEGFYATIEGKVEIDIQGKRTAASGTKVVVVDPHDERTWETTTDEDGYYEIEEAILHQLCSPFKISAEYEEEKIETTYIGPLTEPDRSERYEKNLIFSWQIEMEIRWSGGCVSFGQNVKRFPLTFNSLEDPQTLEWHGKVSKACQWDDDGYKSEINSVANMNLKGKIVSEKKVKKIKLTFDWSGIETNFFERFDSKDSHSIVGKIHTEVPFMPGDYGFTLIEGAIGIIIPYLKPEQYKQRLGAGGSYTVGNWAILSIKSI